MRFGRNIYAIVTLAVACSMIVAGLAKWQGLDAEGGGHIAGYMKQLHVVPACYIVMAMGVFLLGWYWLRLARAITSIAKLLEDGKANVIGSGKNFFTLLGIQSIDRLCKAINKHFESGTSYITKYENQIKDLQIQIQVLQKREKNIEEIIYSIRDAVIVVDEYDKLLLANEAAGRLFNFDYKSSKHKYLSELIDGEHNTFADFISHSRQSKGRATKQEIEFDKAGECKVFDCIVSCVYDRTRKVCGVVAILHDITREKQVQKMKDDFVSHVSHELKTPLASIIAYSEMLCEGEADDKKTRREFYSVIHNQAERLSRLIEDILNTSRIESGLIKVNKEPVSLTMLIEEQLKMIKGYAEEKDIEVIGQKPIIFDQVCVDRDMISQVIVNLLSNAVKYTQSGGSVKIETEVDEAASLVRVRVTDTGVGIPEDEIEHVFDKFYRVNANKKQAKGTGLGLNLVKQIVEKVHDGRVFVKSKVGVGSTFGFELPLATKQIAAAV